MHLPGDKFEENDKALRAPERLVGALKRLPRERVFVPRTVDDAVLAAARRQLRPEAKSGRGWWRLVPWAVGGAAAVIIGLITLQPGRDTPHDPVSARLEDLNNDGVLDVLDAFALAREIEVGVSRSDSRDMNGDGRTDRADVEFLLAKAVRLEKGGRS